MREIGMPNADGAEDFLRQVHSQQAGATHHLLNKARTADGQSSYEVLVEAISGFTLPGTVLDLGCGDGYLLELIGQRYHDQARLVGVDLLATEIAAARQRLGLAAQLFEAHAQALPLADASIDIVVSHLVLMLIAPIEPVIAEIARVLRPRGMFAIMTIGSGSDSPLSAAITAAGRQIAQEDNVHSPLTGDPRTRTPDGVRSLFGPDNGFAARIEAQSLPMLLWLDAAQARAHYLNAYMSQSLSPAAQARFADVIDALCVADSPRDGKHLITLNLCYARGIRLET
jgi:SAM-dependent methyltransferase